jgi:hypothetical protein
MDKTNLLKPTRIIAIVLIVGALALYWWISGGKQVEETRIYSPEENVKYAIQTYLKEEYWPDEYQVERNDLYHMKGFGSLYADNYGMWWRNGEDIVIQVIVGDELGESYKPIGFRIYIQIVGKTGMGYELAEKFVKNIPTEGWEQSELVEHPKIYLKEKSRIASVIWEDEEKQFLLNTEYKKYWEKENHDAFSEREIDELTDVILLVSYPEDQLFHGKLKEFQEADFFMYGTSQPDWPEE